VAKIVEDLPFQVDFAAIALADLIQLVDHIPQIRADLLNLFVALANAVGDHGFTLAWILKLHAFSKKLAPVLMKIDFQNIVIGLLAKAIAIDFIRIGNA